MFMNKRQIVSAYNKGFIDEVYAQLRRYGTIVGDKSFNIEEGHHAGSHRILKVQHHGIDWNVSMHNGEVRSLGHNHVVRG